MYEAANDNTDPRHLRRVMEIAETLDRLGRSAHPRLAIRIIRVAAERAVRGAPE